MARENLTRGISWRVAARVLRFLRTRLGVLTVVVLALLAYGAWSRPVYPDSVDGPIGNFETAFRERYRSATEQQRLSLQWTRDLLFEVASEERRVVWGWEHRVRISIEDKEEWPGTQARASESSFWEPPYRGDWIIAGGARRWINFPDKGPHGVHGEHFVTTYVAPSSWMARLTHFVWPFVRWELR